MPEARAGKLAAWAAENWPGGAAADPVWEVIPADGSPRLFIRLRHNGASLVAMDNPDNPPENRAWLYLARRLDKAGVRVPGIISHDLETGRFLMSDLGEKLLQEEIAACNGDAARIRNKIRPALVHAAAMQAQCARGMDTSVCFDGPELDSEFLSEREAGYFMAEFVQKARGISGKKLPAGLQNDLNEICHRAGHSGPRGFVHRDYQSRNLVVGPKGLGVVDFQGGRLGPSQYDPAALINDPYLDLAWPLRDELIRDYLEIRCIMGEFDRDRFMEGWPFVAASRLMQALGAYAFLTLNRKKRHFARYAAPALSGLAEICRRPGLNRLGSFCELVNLLNRTKGPVL